MKTIFLIALSLFSFATLAEIKEQSFYFDTETSKPTNESSARIDSLINTMAIYEIQIIELGAFSENENKSNDFANYILKKLGVEKSDITVNDYGRQRIKLNFKPESWDRVDIYYFKGRKLSSLIEPSVKITEDVSPVEENRPNYKDRATPKKNQIAKDSPIIMPIEFVGGKNKIKPNSTEYLEYLYKTLDTHQELKAHIRGHVCCGKNYRISKKRAKVVYTYLKKKGISKKRISFDGYSNTLPLIFPELTKEDRSANRRVDIIFSNRN